MRGEEEKKAKEEEEEEGKIGSPTPNLPLATGSSGGGDRGGYSGVVPMPTSFTGILSN